MSVLQFPQYHSGNRPDFRDAATDDDQRARVISLFLEMTDAAAARDAANAPTKHAQRRRRTVLKKKQAGEPFSLAMVDEANELFNECIAQMDVVSSVDLVDFPDRSVKAMAYYITRRMERLKEIFDTTSPIALQNIRT